MAIGKFQFPLKGEKFSREMRLEKAQAFLKHTTLYTNIELFFIYIYKRNYSKIV